MKNISIFSFFSGIGFLDLGFEKNEFNIKFVNDINNKYLEYYAYSRKLLNIKKTEYDFLNENAENFLYNNILYDYINNSKNNNEIIGFIGGPPCPDFSIGGKNAGHEGEKGKLTKTYFDIILKYEPDFFVFENVEGLWKTKNHKIFYEEQKQNILENNYFVFDTITNSLEYGVPQNRNRIFLIGFNKKTFENKQTKEFIWNTTENHKLIEIKNKSWPTINNFKENSKLEMPIDIFYDLTIEYAFIKNDVYNHKNTNMFFTPKSDKFSIIPEGQTKNKCFKRLHRWRYSPTACYGNNEVHLHPYKKRRISVAEALAIQSLPKEFILPENMPLTDSFKTIGNGVPYLLANNIAKNIKDFIKND